MKLLRQFMGRAQKFVAILLQRTLKRWRVNVCSLRLCGFWNIKRRTFLHTSKIGQPTEVIYTKSYAQRWLSLRNFLEPLEDDWASFSFIKNVTLPSFSQPFLYSNALMEILLNNTTTCLVSFIFIHVGDRCRTPKNNLVLYLKNSSKVELFLQKALAIRTQIHCISTVHSTLKRQFLRLCRGGRCKTLLRTYLFQTICPNAMRSAMNLNPWNLLRAVKLYPSLRWARPIHFFAVKMIK